MSLEKMPPDIGSYSSFTMNATIILWYQFDVVVKVLKLPLKYISVKRILASKLSTLQAIGYSVCIEAPKQTLIFCFSVQKEILFFPFRCTKMAFDLAAYLLRRARGKSPQPPNIAEIITGTKNPSMKDVQIAAQNLQKSAVNAINEYNKAGKLEKYKEELEKWSAETDKKIEDCFILNAEDKEVIKSLAINMKHIRSLKARKSKLNTSFCESLTNIVSKEFVSSEEIKSIKNNYKNMTAVSSEIKETKDDCLAVINTSNKLNNLFSKIVLQNESIQPIAGQIFEGSNKIQALVSRVRLDNDSLKSTLAGTNEKLQEILSVTENISRTVQDLYGQFMEVPKLHKELCSMKSKLEEQQRLLKVVETERNNMQDKFALLEGIIQEEQNFLDSVAKSRESTEELSLCEETPIAKWNGSIRALERGIFTD